MKVLDEDTGLTIVENLKPAYSFTKRLKGLMFDKRMQPQSGVHIKPCTSVHTFFMKFPIDIIYVDREMKVVGLEHSLEPGKTGKRFKNVHSVIELEVGRILDLGITVGQTLKIQQ